MKALLLFLVALFTFGCAAPVVSEEQTGETELAAWNDQCLVFPYEDSSVSPIPYGSSGTRVEFRLANLGNVSCSFYAEIDARKGDGMITGPAQGPFTLGPLLPGYTSPTKLIRQNFGPYEPPCQYMVWTKFDPYPGRPGGMEWRGYGWNDC